MAMTGIFLSLQELDLSYVGMAAVGAKALSRALRYHNPCPHLKKLRLGENEAIGDEGVMELAKAIEAGGTTATPRARSVLCGYG